MSFTANFLPRQCSNDHYGQYDYAQVYIEHLAISFSKAAIRLATNVKSASNISVRAATERNIINLKIMLVSWTWCFCLTFVFISGTAKFIFVEKTSLTATEYHERTKRNEVLCVYSAVFAIYLILGLSRNTMILVLELYRAHYTTARGYECYFGW